MVDFWEIVMGLFGGLALFLFGLGLLTDALKSLAGSGMRTLLAKLTTNRVRSALTGALITAVIQSSSVTTVLVVGFVSAGLLSLENSIGVIMGANVGTTVTAQVIAFEITEYALAMIAVGFAVKFIVKREQIVRYGSALLGLGLLFLGMHTMSEAASPLRTWQPFIDLMRSMENRALAILAGTIFTAIVQSSSATVGLVIVLAGRGLITLEAAIGLTLGANVGTCVTALLASIGKPREAVRAAMAHVVFNVAGMLVWVGLIGWFADLMRSITPDSAPRQVANAHTIIKLMDLVIFLPFAGTIARLVVRLVPDRPAAEEGVRPIFLDENLLETPELGLGAARMEICRLGAMVREMLVLALPATLTGTRAELADLEKRERDVDKLYDAIVVYLGRISQVDLTAELARRLSTYVSVVNHFENVGDTVETNLLHLGRERLDQGVRVSPVTMEMLEPLEKQVIAAFSGALRAFENDDREEARRVTGMKHEVNRQSTIAKEHLAHRLAAEEPNRLWTFRVETDIVENLKRLFFFSRRVAKVVTGEKAAELEKLA